MIIISQNLSNYPRERGVPSLGLYHYHLNHLSFYCFFSFGYEYQKNKHSSI